MKKILYIFLLFPLFVLAQNGDNSPVKAAPGIYGGGAEATGGRGKLLYIVNTLTLATAATYNAASGGDDAYLTGGFRDAVEIDSVGYVIFDLSGEIDLGTGGTGNAGSWPTHTDMGVAATGKTFFGQSAPQGGITLTGGTFRIGGWLNAPDLGNLVFRYMRSRPYENKTGAVDYGVDDAYTWGFLFYGGNDIVVDHCSSSFAYDKAIGSAVNTFFTSKPGCPCTMYRQTFSHNIIGDSATGMYSSVTPDQAGDPEELVDEISYLNNVLVDVNRTPVLSFDGLAEVTNNVIHSTPSKGTRVYHLLKLNIINNHYGDKFSYNWVDTNAEETKEPVMYAKGAIFDGTVNGSAVDYNGSITEDNRDMWTNAARTTFPGNQYFTDTKHTWTGAVPYTEVTSAQTFTNLITNGDVGAYKYLDNNGEVQIYRDSYDTGLLNVVATNANYTNKAVGNWVMPTLPANTRPGSYDTDNDGMSDAWEMRVYGDLDESYRGDFDGDGYENIEEYMNQVDFDYVAPTAIVWADDTQSVSDIGNLNLTVNFTPSNTTDKGVTYSSTNTGVVNNSGVVVGVGTCTLTVTADDTTNGTLTDDMGVTIFAAETPGLQIRNGGFYNINGGIYKVIIGQ